MRAAAGAGHETPRPLRRITTGLHRAHGALLRFDPGFTRLRLATRTTATVALTLGVLFGLKHFVGLPVTVVLLGAMIGMLSSMAVRDPEPAQQRLTTLLLPLPAAVAIVLGAFLAPYWWAADAVFLVVMFLATWARRFGPRWMTFGMIAFIAYFFSIFLKASVEQLPWMLLALVIGALCAYLLRFVVLRERPERTLRHLLHAFAAHLVPVIDAVTEAVEAEGWSDDARRTLRRAAIHLNECALMVEDQAQQSGDRHTAQGVALKVFDAELATERLGAAGRLAAPAPLAPASRQAFARCLQELGAAVRLDQPFDRLRAVAAHAADLAAQTRDAEAWSRLATRMHDLASSMQALRKDGIDASSLAGSDDSDAPDAPMPDQDNDEDHGKLHPALRQALQVTLAAALAIIAGEFISPRRWYWAVIAAFVVFAGTSTRGDTLGKAWQRILGTLAGIASGAIVATVVGGNVAITAVLMFVCIFLAYYLFQVAYGLMIFWITTLLALLYGLLGQFSFGLLVLRLEETAAGAAIGVAVAALVLPVSTRRTAARAAVDVTEALQAFVHAAVTELSGAATTDLGAAARQVDKRFSALRGAARPVATGLSGLFGRGHIRWRLRMFMACAYYVRSLSRHVPRARVAEALPPGIEDAGARMQTNLASLAAVLAGRSAQAVTPAGEQLEHWQRQATTGDDGAVLARREAIDTLRRLDEAVIELATHLGVPRDDQK